MGRQQFQDPRALEVARYPLLLLGLAITALLLWGAGARTADAQDLSGVEAPTLSTSYLPPSIEAWGTTVLQFFIDNSANDVAAEDVSFNISVPPNQFFALPDTLSSTCDGAIEFDYNHHRVILTDATVPAGGTCAVTVGVVPHGGSEAQISSPTFETSLGESTPVHSVLEVLPGHPTAPIAEISVQESRLEVGESTTVTLVVDNSASPRDAHRLSALLFQIGSAQLDLDPSSLSNSCGGSVEFSSVRPRLLIREGFVAAHASCRIEIRARAVRPGANRSTLR